jgi:hypothetical protein
VKDAKAKVPEAEEYSYTERDVILYALGLGATEQELQWVYEQDEGFQVSLSRVEPYPLVFTDILLATSFARRSLRSV